MSKLWSHAIAQAGPSVNPDLAEALSRRYGKSKLIVLALRSGNFAIFGADHQIVSLLAPEELLPETLRTLAIEAENNVSVQISKSRLGEPKKQSLSSDLSIEDII